jgi:hypothetical protein
MKASSMPRPKGKMPLEEYDKPQSLYLETRRLMKADKRTTRMISQLTGMPFYWLKKFRAGEIDNPSVNRMQHLYEFISKKELLK